MLPKFSYVRPNMLDQAIMHLQSEGAAIHAGGTDLLGCLRERIMTSSKIVSLSGLTELAGIRQTAAGDVRIGALTTITEISENETVQKLYPGLAGAAAEVASPQLRNQGTIGGNLCQKPRCWYYRGEFDCRRKGGEICFAMNGENQFHAIFGHDSICAITHPSDTAPMLTALGAEVQAETVLTRGEIITWVKIPAPEQGLYSSYRKIRARRAWDFALAGVALALVMQADRVTRAAIVLSGAAPIPWRSAAAEKAISGRPLTDETIASAARAAVAEAEPLAANGYKIAMFRGMLEEELAKAREGYKTGT